MNRFRMAFARLRGMLYKGPTESDLSTELNAHLDSLTTENIRRGMNSEEARQAARREFGGIEQTKELYREQRSLPFVDALVQDLRFAFRILAKSPGFTAVAVLTLALGVGVNVTLFGAINGLLLRPPANVESPAELVSLYQTVAKGGVGGFRPVWSVPDFLYYSQYRNHESVFSGLTAHSLVPLALGIDGINEQVLGEIVSGDYFHVLGTRPFLGRFFTLEEDDTPASRPVVILSYELWRDHLSSDPNILNRAIAINGHSYSVVGVAPRGMTDLGVQVAPAVWVPLAAQSALGWPPDERDVRSNRSVGWLTVLGRLKPGVTRERALTILNPIARQLEQDYPAIEKGRGIALESGTTMPPFLRGAVIGFVGLLQVLGGLLLLIPCANVAGLLLARTWARRSEITIRSAIGASRGRIVRQLLTESLLVALGSGVVGSLLALWGTRALTHFKLPIDVPLAVNLQPDVRVLGFTVLLVVVTVLLCGLAPALRLSRAGLSPQLGRQQNLGDDRRSKTQRLLLVFQVSISLLLLLGAGLCMRSLNHAQKIDPGFETRDILSFTISPKLNGYPEAKLKAFYEQLQGRLETLGGVRSTSMTQFMPLSFGELQEDVSLYGESGASPEKVSVGDNFVAPGYFRTMGIPILRGHEFADGNRDAESVIINETMAHNFFPDADPIGRQIRLGNDTSAHVLQIVGIARDSKYWTLGESARPFFYRLFSPVAEGPFGTTVIVRTSFAPDGLVSAVRSEVQSLDGNLPVIRIETMNEHLSSALLLARTTAILQGILGSFGLFLAMVGLYGSVSYSVARRTHEIGVRMALGADKKDVLNMVVREGLFLTLGGLVIGLGLAFLSTRFLSSLLYGISARDPLTFAIVPLLLLGIALLACWIPARRAMRVDPMVALRYE